MRTTPQGEQVVEKSRREVPPWTLLAKTRASETQSFQRLSGDQGAGELVYIQHFMTASSLLDHDPKLSQACLEEPCRTTNLDQLIALAKKQSSDALTQSIEGFVKKSGVSPGDLSQLRAILRQVSRDHIGQKVEVADIYYEKKLATNSTKQLASVYDLWVLIKIPETLPGEILAQTIAKMGRKDDLVVLALKKALQPFSFEALSH